MTLSIALTGIGVPLYSDRNLSMTLEPIDGGAFDRDVNGLAVDLTPPSFKGKYKATITCTDANAPSSDLLVNGTLVTIDSVQELFYVSSGGSPAKSVVPGSIRTLGDFKMYRPRIDMMVIGFNFNRSEPGAQTGWTMQLIER